MATLVLAFVIASLYALVFHVIFGHGWLRLFFYLLVSILGFGLGHFLASIVGQSWLYIGALNFAEATIVSWVFLFAARAWQR
jgi:Na+/citrate or Na+/malate symporter